MERTATCVGKTKGEVRMVQLGERDERERPGMGASHRRQSSSGSRRRSSGCLPTGRLVPDRDRRTSAPRICTRTTRTRTRLAREGMYGSDRIPLCAFLVSARGFNRREESRAHGRATSEMMAVARGRPLCTDRSPIALGKAAFREGVGCNLAMGDQGPSLVTATRDLTKIGSHRRLCASSTASDGKATCCCSRDAIRNAEQPSTG